MVPSTLIDGSSCGKMFGLFGEVVGMHLSLAVPNQLISITKPQIAYKTIYRLKGAWRICKWLSSGCRLLLWELNVSSFKCG